MSNQPISDQPRSSLGRKLGLVVLVVVVLLVVAYFVISSSAFIKGVVLPRVAKSLNAEITVADVSLSPFSQLTLDKLKVQAAGAEPVLTADQVRVRYSLFSILGGNYVVQEVSLGRPVIQIVTEPNGGSNLDPLTKGQGEQTSSGSTSGKPVQFSLQKLNLTDGTVRMVNKAKDGSTSSTEVSQLNVTAENVGNGQAGKLTLASGLRMDHRVPQGQPGTNDLLEAKANGSFDFKLDPKLMPQTVSGNATLNVAKSEGAYTEVNGLAAALQADMTPTEIRQLALRFERGGRGLGRIQASGPLDLAKMEGRVKLEVQSIDRQVLNLVGASRGWDFADSQLNATNYVDLVRGAEEIGARGQIAGRQVSVRQQGQATPTVDLDVDYDVTVNRRDQSAVIKKLTMTGEQQRKRVLEASLSNNIPMTVTWAANAKGFTSSTFQLALNDLKLEDWRMLAGTNIPTGRLSAKLTVQALQDGKRMDSDINVGLRDAATRIGSNQVTQLQVILEAKATLQNLRTVDLTQYKLDATQGGQPLVKANGSAHYDLSKADLALQISAELALPTVLRVYPYPDLTASNGLVRLSSAISHTGQKYSATGNLFLGDFTGRYGSYSFRDYQTALDYDVAMDEPLVQIRSASLALRQGYNAGGNVTLTGEYDQNKKTARANLRLVDLNENGLRPFLTPSLGNNELNSISLSGTASCNYDPKAETALKADITVTNWVVATPEPGVKAPKLGVQVQLDGSLRQQLVDVKQCVLKLSPTPRAKNELQLTGHLDMGKTNATPSQIKLASDSLDLTPYYNIFAGTGTNVASAKPSAPATNTGPTTSGPAPTPREPAPVNLPVEQLTAEAKIGRLYLRDVAITNLQTTAKIDHGQVSLTPFEMTLNGAPVSATAQLNLAVPGYIYDVNMKMEKVPLEPLANSFSSSPQGSLKGDLYAQAQFRGAGTTGTNLQKNLAGNLSLNMTNMNYEIVGAKAKRMLQPIALALRVPELLQTPINWIAAKSDVGKGQIDLQQFTVESQAFHAESKGKIPIAAVLTNSPLDLPVTLALRRTMAEKVNLLPANTPTNAVYAELPTFVTLKGTVGDPKTEINKLVIGGLLARSVGGLTPIVGDKAGNLLQGVGSLLSGQQGATSGTNSASAGTNSTANLVQGIAGLFNQPKTAATNAPAPASAATPSSASSAPARVTQTVPNTKTNAAPAAGTNKPAKPSVLNELLKAVPK